MNSLGDGGVRQPAHVLILGDAGGLGFCLGSFQSFSRAFGCDGGAKLDALECGARLIDSGCSRLKLFQEASFRRQQSGFLVDEALVLFVT